MGRDFLIIRPIHADQHLVVTVAVAHVTHALPQGLAFAGGNLSGDVQGHDGLIAEDEAVLVQGIAQPGRPTGIKHLHRIGIVGGDEHIGLVAPLAFGQQTGLVGLVEGLLLGLGVLAEQGDAHAALNAVVLAIVVKLPQGQPFAETVGHIEEILGVDVVQHHRELITAIAGQDIGLANALA